MARSKNVIVAKTRSNRSGCRVSFVRKNRRINRRTGSETIPWISIPATRGVLTARGAGEPTPPCSWTQLLSCDVPRTRQATPGSPFIGLTAAGLVCYHVPGRHHDCASCARACFAARPTPSADWGRERPESQNQSQCGPPSFSCGHLRVKETYPAAIPASASFPIAGHGAP